MKSAFRIPRFLTRSLLAVFLGSCLVAARVPFTVAAPYEDTLRVLILYNLAASGTSVCPDLPPVGTSTMLFVKSALDTIYIKHVKTVAAHSATRDTVWKAFPGSLPHVIVHVNAGWGGLSGPTMKDILNWALGNNVGVVEVGDDDLQSLAPAFPWGAVIDMWYPMGEGLQLDQPGDSLFVRCATQRDRLVDRNAYPYLTGLVTNAHDIIGDTVIPFRPVGGPGGRCQADPDVFSPIYPEHADMYHALAYQQGLTGGNPVGGDWDYPVISVFQDTLWPTDTLWQGYYSALPNGYLLRRAVSLSMQPQFLADPLAARQIVYDAIMYASLVHTANQAPQITGIPGLRSIGRSAGQVRDAEGRTVAVFDVEGRTVFQYRGQRSVSTASLRSGVYIIHSSGARLHRRPILDCR